MRKEDVATEISSDGLRYKSKSAGSPFGERGHIVATMSCMKCGHHKPRSLGSYKRLLGASHFFCGDCRPQTKSVKAA